jgi:hypothetical protein
MANLETQILDDIIVKSRRKMLTLGGTALAGLIVGGTKAADAQTVTYTDADILNFALNLEYLEANFYYLAAFGTTINVPNAASLAAGGPTGGYAIKGVVTGSNPAAGGTVTTKTGGPAACAVPFTAAANPTLTASQIIAIGSYAAETAIEEGKHVNFLYTALGSAAVAQPPINLDGGATSPATAAFNALATAAGIPGGVFDPFASASNFLIGAYIFEDVGVTAYHGAAPLITQTATGKTYLQAAAGILAVEAYHAGLVRTTINAVDTTGTLITYTNAISTTRAALANAAKATNTLPSTPVGFDTNPDDYGLATKQVSLAGGANVTATQLTDADQTYEYAFARSTTQVLNIVTGGGAMSGSTVVSPAKGVFYPSSMNGLFR